MFGIQIFRTGPGFDYYVYAGKPGTGSGFRYFATENGDRLFCY